MRIWVESVEQGTAKTGNPFLKVSCIFEDRTSRQFYVWEFVNDFLNLFNQGNRCFECTFGGDANFPKIASFNVAQGSALEFYSFIYPSDEYASQVLESLISTIKDEFYLKLIRKVLSFPGTNGFSTLYETFRTIPAAKAFHHDFRYGLLRHTHEVMSVVSRVSEGDLFKKNIDRELALTGAFLHDVGKCFEYSFDGINTADYGDSLEVNQIYLASHLSKGAELIALAYHDLCMEDETIKTQVNDLRIEHLKHIVLSHHLQREWASVSKSPQTLEAMLVFIGDYFSAANGKFDAIDWSNVSPDHLLGSTSKYDTFFGFTPLLRLL